jgi:hypothetical protein
MKLVTRGLQQCEAALTHFRAAKNVPYVEASSDVGQQSATASPASNPEKPPSSAPPTPGGPPSSPPPPPPAPGLITALPTPPIVPVRADHQQHCVISQDSCARARCIAIPSRRRKIVRIPPTIPQAPASVAPAPPVIHRNAVRARAAQCDVHFHPVLSMMGDVPWPLLSRACATKRASSARPRQKSDGSHAGSPSNYNSLPRPVGRRPFAHRRSNSFPQGTS